MATTIKMLTCSNCGAQLKLTIHRSEYPYRMVETVECPICNAEVYRENTTAKFDVEKID